MMSKNRQEDNRMNCKKYRACLVGVLAAALICGALLYMKYGRESETPVDGVLVERNSSWEAGTAA